MMTMTRRDVLVLGTAAAAVMALGPVPAFASTEDAMKSVMDFTGGKTPAEGRISLDMPEIAENGNTVPLAVSVESPMTEADHVVSVLVLAAGNPNPGVAQFNFTPASGSASASTRMRLAKTQDVIAVAKMSNGDAFMTKRTVKVTIGGCGG